jgi:hypothetical protein
VIDDIDRECTLCSKTNHEGGDKYKTVQVETFFPDWLDTSNRSAKIKDKKEKVTMNTVRKTIGFARVLLVLSLSLALASPVLAAPPLPGAIFTTDSTCTGVNVNIYGDKADVYLDGGPAHTGAAGLPDGYYYVQVTEPEGTLLGTSVGSSNETPIQVVNGEFYACYQLSAILIKASDGTQGYDDTTNSGGEYKVWVSTVYTFDNNSTKTDNFKVKAGPTPPPTATLNVLKFYDANANGVNDDGQPITGWKVRIQDTIDYIRYTPVTIIVDPDDYIVTEFYPVETNWMPTTANPVYITLAADDNKTVEFGNLCLGAGGGLTLGFWSNKNGQALFGNDDLALMVRLNLRNADGTTFDPASYAKFRTWLLSATATNMAYMLSAQLAAMELNVFNGKVKGDALIYAPGTKSANDLGFATVNAVMEEANAELGLHGLTLADSPDRAYQEALKNALDKANNNTTFVQPTPCPFTFGE